MFDTSAAGSGHYPLYVSSSPSTYFNDEQFHAKMIQAANRNVTAVTHVFAKQGRYMFVDATHQHQQTIVDVEYDCGVSESYHTQSYPAASSEQLYNYAHHQFTSLPSNPTDQSLSTGSDYSILGVMIGLAVLLSILILYALYTFTHSSWKTASNEHHWLARLLARSASTEPSYKKSVLSTVFDRTLWESRETQREAENVTKGLIPLNESQLVAGSTAAGASVQEYDENGQPILHAESGKSAATGEAGIVPVKPPSSASDAMRSDDETEAVDPLLHELSANFDFEGFDFTTLYTIMDETKNTIANSFAHQDYQLQVGRIPYAAGNSVRTSLTNRCLMYHGCSPADRPSTIRSASRSITSSRCWR